MQTRILTFTGLILASLTSAHASVTLLLEEPYGTFGGMNPTGHAAVYLSNVCAASPVSLRRCKEGEHGVVISRYHRVGGYDWIAIPLLPYLYAVNRPDEVPLTVSSQDVVPYETLIEERIWKRSYRTRKTDQLLKEIGLS